MIIFPLLPPTLRLAGIGQRFHRPAFKLQPTASSTPAPLPPPPPLISLPLTLLLLQVDSFPYIMVKGPPYHPSLSMRVILKRKVWIWKVLTRRAKLVSQ